MEKSRLEVIFEKFESEVFSSESYKKLNEEVRNEIFNSEPYLFFIATKESKIEEGEIGILSAGMSEGFHAIWVYSSEERARLAAKEKDIQECNFVMMKSSELFDMVEANKINRVVINNTLDLRTQTH